MIERLLCGCETETDQGGHLVLRVQTCDWCNSLRLQAARMLQYEVREGREASEAVIAPFGLYSKLQ